MDEIGFENTEQIKQLTSEAKKWEFIYNTAKFYGFEGIHFTPSLYKEFGLTLDNIPSYFQDFRLTFHIGGLFKLATEKDCQVFDLNISECLKIAVDNKMHDISVHPPYTYGLSLSEKRCCYDYFDRIVTKWLNKVKEHNISFSLETHVSGKFFLFDGFDEYIEFVDKHADLGILIDISHNYYDNYSEDQIISLLKNKNVKSLHISDARQNVDFREGTHLAIGEGTVDFIKLVEFFKSIPCIFGALEIKSSNEGLLASLSLLKKI